MNIVNFEPKPTGFSLNNAQILGQASAVAYEDPATCERWAKSVGFGEAFQFFSNTDVIHRSDTQGFIAQSPQSIMVAFRGTQPRQPIDWLSDFEASHETWGHPVGKVHKGFYEALRVVWGQPLGGLRILPERLVNRGERTIWITGHSLGGALALLCAAQTAFVSQVPIQGLYTFGQPRAGDDAFARLVQDAFGQRIFRFVNDKDIVPRVPFFGMGFRHLGTELFFDRQHTRKDAAASVENLASALRLAGLALNLDPIEQAAKMLFDATIKSGFHTNPLTVLQQMMGSKEDFALGASRALLASGMQNVGDHDMRNNYLSLMGTSLVLSQTV